MGEPPWPGIGTIRDRARLLTVAASLMFTMERGSRRWLLGILPGLARRFEGSRSIEDIELLVPPPCRKQRDRNIIPDACNYISLSERPSSNDCLTNSHVLEVLGEGTVGLEESRVPT